MELQLDANGDKTKLTWRLDSGPFSKPILLPKDLLLKRGAAVRAALNALNEHVGKNRMDIRNDVSRTLYRKVLTRLREEGRALFNALFDFRNPRAQELLEQLHALHRGAELTVHCSDDQTTLPLGFVYKDDTPAPALTADIAPSRADFAGFWLDRFKLTMRIAGGRCNELVVDPSTFKSLYALHREDLEAAAGYMGDDRERLNRLLTTIEFREGYYDWACAERACDDIADCNSVVFVFAHSDGDYLKLDDSTIDCIQFAEMLQRNHSERHTALLVLNCCLSVAGGENCSLLRAASEPGFCGLIGTEAEILNACAIRCGTRLMWDLCAEGLTLGESFDRMQKAEDLFPLNLLYTCYADRGFRLARPFEHLKVA
jgi:hypothetical protein